MFGTYRFQLKRHLVNVSNYSLIYSYNSLESCIIKIHLGLNLKLFFLKSNRKLKPKYLRTNSLTTPKFFFHLCSGIFSRIHPQTLEIFLTIFGLTKFWVEITYLNSSKFVASWWISMGMYHAIKFWPITMKHTSIAFLFVFGRNTCPPKFLAHHSSLIREEAPFPTIVNQTPSTYFNKNHIHSTFWFLLKTCFYSIHVLLPLKYSTHENSILR